MRTGVLRLSSWRHGAMCRTLTTGASGPFTVSACGQPGRRPEAPRAAEGYRDRGEGPEGALRARERGPRAPGAGRAGL